MTDTNDPRLSTQPRFTKDGYEVVGYLQYGRLDPAAFTQFYSGPAKEQKAAAFEQFAALELRGITSGIEDKHGDEHPYVLEEMQAKGTSEFDQLPPFMKKFLADQHWVGLFRVDPATGEPIVAVKPSTQEGGAE